LPNKAGRDVIVMMDTTYWGRRFGVVIFKDAIEGDVLWYKFIYKRETVADYKEGGRLSGIALFYHSGSSL